uniref:Protein transport protein Sec31A n=1 Tax=Periophthalmus magnuspinnatus TaxID=409849 RepID=A0A3B4AVM5_9GOBI
MHCSGMAWNPEVATQLVMASEDDRMPVIQMWDLRFASSPLKILENHTRGVLAIAWSSADPELLLSCGKDGRILCWNPNTAEILYELPTGNQWCFDIQWCPRNPAVLSSAGFNSCINIYSIMGGTNQAQSQRHVDQISNSFGNMDPFGTGQTLPPLELPQSGTLSTTVNPLKKPPKWIQRPVGASFAFGGKLVSLDNGKPNPQQPNSHVVHVSQVVTETDLLKRSNQLQDTISSGQFLEFCQGKINLAENEFEKTVWSFLKANFDSDSRSRFLELLGYNKEELALKVDYTFKLHIFKLVLQCVSKLLSRNLELKSQQHFFFQLIFFLSSDVDRLITQALLTGDFEGAVELCLHDNRMADSIILAIAGGAELLKKTQKKYFIKSQSKLTKVRYIILAVVMKDLHDIMSTCELQNWKEALAAVMTYAQTQEFSALCDLLGGRLEGANDPMLQAQACLCYICAGNLEKLVSCWIKAQEGSNPHSLQDLVEKVVVMQHAVEQTQNLGPLAVGVLLAKKMSEYAKLLASQGCLTTALSYLPNESNHVCIQLLRERLSHALGQQDPASFKTQSIPSKVPHLQTPTQSNNPYSVVQPTTTAPAQLQYYQPVSYIGLFPQNYTPPAPITAPIMAPLGVNLQSQQMPSGSPQTMGQIPHALLCFQPPQSMPAEKITKKPIPDEHFVLKTTFEGLIQKCLIVATDPQTKRKLDDANKRLETLYDKLREQTLSPAIVGGLHNIARTIESRSYAEGLNIHTHIVSSSNFSEISGFMPVLKVVLTQAKKLGV